MIATLKPYPTMKDSGMPWLGEVPELWKQQTLWTLSNLRVELNPGNLPLLSVFLDRGVIRYEEGGGQVHAPSLDLSNYQVVHPGDFVLNNQQAWRGSVGVSRYHGIISPAYIVLRLSQRLDSAYANHLMRCPAVVDQFVAASKGVGDIQRQIYWPYLRIVQVPLPELEEQSAIVRFLDYAERRIQRYIRAKQKLITLLEEQKQAIIHRAVTRGLDPNVRVKPSGVEWFGDVPEHWGVLPIKRAFYSMDYGISESPTDAGTIRVLTMGNIKNGRVTIPQTGGVAAVDVSLLLEPGDLLFNRTNSSELVGKVGLFMGSESPVTFASYLVRMRPRPEHEPEYLNAVLNDVSVLSIARREAIPSLHQSNLNPTRYGRLQVTLPPLEEQRAILQVLKTMTSDLGKAIATAHNEVFLLREYRTRLITDVVTGKLDVREAAAKLPEETYEPEPLDDAKTLVEGDEETEGADFDAVPEEAEA